MKTVFIRAVEAPVDEKALVILAAVRGLRSSVFKADLSTFAQVPRSPFAYWVGDALRRCFAQHPPFEAQGRTAKQGLATADDFRFVRLANEVRSESKRQRWVAFAKGGSFSPFYFDQHLCIDWAGGGAILKAKVEAEHGNVGKRVYNEHLYLRPGLTWPRRTNGLSFRALPAGCIFADKGPAAFVEGNDTGALLALCAVLNGGAFGALVAVQLARTELAQSFEVGLIQQTPVPGLGAEDVDHLARLALRSWSLRRDLDTRSETSHAFLLPALLQTDGAALSDRAQEWGQRTAGVQAELEALTTEVDDHVYRLYGISDEDRLRIEQGFGTSSEPEEGPNDEDDDDSAEEAAEVDAAPMVASLLSWTLGVAFGRLDVRLAIGDRDAPPEPEPFDPLPFCSPGMLTGDDGLPVATPPSGYPLTFPADGILVDDPGHPRDLIHAVRSVFETVFDDANARWHEAAELLGTPDLRSWFARDFFEPHIKRYSKSRRKAPIYWQLGTASGSYSVWLYIHRATGDTLFRVLNDFVGPKLDHEKTKLDSLTQEAGPNPSAAQRRVIEQQETFVGELQALKTEIARVAPLWKPNLDDGVILNFAPLWRLVPQSRSWQTECKKAWDKLVAGDYDWAHLAMHLWPERVVPKCMDDRSLAIAHGLEDTFWYQDESGTWCKSEVDAATLQWLIENRTSSTVKAALQDLLTATAVRAPGAGARRAPAAGTRVREAEGKPKATVSTPKVGPLPSDRNLDPETLKAVRAAIAGVAEGASKSDVLAVTGLSDSDWNQVIAVLLDRGEVTRTGQKRGTRYHVKGGSDA